MLLLRPVLFVAAVCFGIYPYALHAESRREMKRQTPENTDQLGVINQKILAPQATLPVVELKDGSRVQTGTVATMLHNINLYNKGARGDVERELELSIPTLFKIGLFDLFSPSDWVIGDNEGRRFIGEKAFEYIKKRAQG
jgi:hypothetical protein